VSDYVATTRDPFREAIVTCAFCGRADTMESGAPGPVGWLDLSSWDGNNRATGLGWYCSLDCLQDDMPELEERYGGRYARSRFD
jgi:hypothetical protein